MMLFHVQATDVPEYEFDLQADETETREREERTRDDAIPKKFTQHEVLMDVKPNPDVVQPVGKGLFLYIFLKPW